MKIKKKERLDRILELIGDGYMTYQIVEVCSKEWAIGRRGVERYLTAVYKFLKTELTHQDKELAILELQELERQYKGRGDAKSLLKLKDMRFKIQGFYNHEIKADVTSGGKPIDEILFTLINKKEDLDNGSEH